MKWGSAVKLFSKFTMEYRKKKDKLVMGAKVQSQTTKQKDAKEPKNEYRRDVEKYFRPSCLSILNNRVMDFQFFDSYDEKSHDEIVLPASLMSSPEKTIIHYFSILREAENLTKNQMGGCGTVGMSKIPYPVAYNFLTKEYQKKVSYPSYLHSFRGIGHTNLIKLNKLPVKGDSQTIQFFIELETIEGSSKNLTYFAYYYGYVSIKKEKNMYKIEDINLTGEDFLCAAYHLWQHDAEAVVDVEYGNWCKLVKKRLPTKKEGYFKNIDFVGTDGNEYRFVFIELTNSTDLLFAQYKKTHEDKWEPIKIDPEKCLKDKK